MKRTIIILCFLLCLPFLSIRIKAYDSSYFSDKIEIEELYNSIPDYANQTNLTEDFGDKSTQEIAESINADSFRNFLLKSLSSLLSSSCPTLVFLLGVVIIISIINTAKNSLSSEHFAQSISYITTIILSLFSCNAINESYKFLNVFLDSINAFINALLPIILALFSLGGNVASAVTSSFGMSFLLTVLNYVFQSILLPLINISFAMLITSKISGVKSVGQLGKIIRNTFLFLITSISTLFSIYLLFKTNLSVASDGLAARTIKFAGSFIPVVGGPLGESIRTIMSGLSVVKSSVGMIGVFILFVITLPVLLSLFLTKFTFDFSSVVSCILGCEKEGEFLKEVAGIYNFLIAITVCISILLLFEMIIFIFISPALKL